MAKRVKEWDFYSGSTTLGNGTTLADTIIEFPENSVGATTALVRVIGSVRLSLSKLAPANVNARVWVGLHMGSADVADGTIFAADMGTDDDSNEEAWLFRQPLPLYDYLQLNGTEVLDLMSDHRIDWQVRGGKGSTLSPGQKQSFVITGGGWAAGEFVLAHWQFLCLHRAAGA